MSEDQRGLALALACRVVPAGAPTGHYLSTARTFHHYLATGLSQTGANNRQGLQIGSRDIEVRLDGDLDADLAGRLTAAVKQVLTS